MFVKYNEIMMIKKNIYKNMFKGLINVYNWFLYVWNLLIQSSSLHLDQSLQRVKVCPDMQRVRDPTKS